MSEFRKQLEKDLGVLKLQGEELGKQLDEARSISSRWHSKYLNEREMVEHLRFTRGRSATIIEEKEREIAELHTILQARRESMAKLTKEIAGLKDQRTADRNSILLLSALVKKLTKQVDRWEYMEIDQTDLEKIAVKFEEQSDLMAENVEAMNKKLDWLRTRR